MYIPGVLSTASSSVSFLTSSQLLVENNMGFAAIGADDAEKLVDAVEI